MITSLIKTAFKALFFGALRTASMATLAIILSAQSAQAGEFNFNWENVDWPANSVGPVSFTITDEFGYEVTSRVSITRFGGTALNGYPDDLTIFGTKESLVVVWDANNQAGNIGESTNTVTLELLSEGSPIESDGILTEVSDIDSVDNFSTADRCDFVTLTGNAGDPDLAYASNNAATRSVIIGPGPGSGNTGNIAANQAQCVFNTAQNTGSPTSNGDDNGTILATYPSGTHTMSVAYDDSIEAVYNFAGMNPAARGGGFYSGTVITINTGITLEKDTTATEFTTVGEVITYSFEITNDGPLPINTNQNILIQDDKIGTFSCGNITSNIAVGDTISCTADYTVTAADVSAGFVTNNATAGVGTPGQSFADRFQSNTDTVQVDIAAGSAQLTGSKSIAVWDPDALGLYATPGNDVIYTITSSNTGDGATDNDSIVLIDIMPNEVEFYNADIDGVDGPEIGPIIFTQSAGAGLTFDPTNDVAYSDSMTRPADFDECQYPPNGGYDPAVTFICFNPKGALASGDPDPEFSVSFRARIK